MKISIKSFNLLLITLLTAGCSVTEKNSSRLCADADGNFNKCENISFISMGKEHNSNLFKPGALFKPGTNFQTINEYTEQMVHVLYQKVSQKNIEKAIAVPPFISFPSTEKDSPQLNASVAEAFAIDMQNIGLPVGEFILTNSSAKEQTNFRSYIAKLSGSQYFGYVLKGTMRKREHGTMVYAKIIDLETQKVIAATSKFLPNYLLTPLK